jgi:hypothetical protein
MLFQKDPNISQESVYRRTAHNSSHVSVRSTILFFVTARGIKAVPALAVGHRLLTLCVGILSLVGLCGSCEGVFMHKLSMTTLQTDIKTKLLPFEINS